MKSRRRRIDVFTRIAKRRQTDGRRHDHAIVGRRFRYVLPVANRVIAEV
jgi:hypothetical protein